MKKHLEFFKEDGYAVIPDAFSDEGVKIISAVIDRDLVEN